MMSDLKKARQYYVCQIPKGLQKMEKGPPLKVGVLFSGGQAPGGHTLVAALFDALKEVNKESLLIGFLNGPQGLIEGSFKLLTKDLVDEYRNLGGFDLLGSSRTKIETLDQFEKVLEVVKKNELNGLVIVGGDDSNTNAFHLATYFKEKNSSCSVIGTPKTIDGDLKNESIELSFGFDTATKVYSEIIGNLCIDAKSQKKYTFFVKVMGRSASHIALECALQTHPNLCLIGEEILAKRLSLKDVIDQIADLIEKRAQMGKNYGVILIPEGIIEFIPGIELSSELDPHGNLQVSKIESERFFIEQVSSLLQKRGVQNFNPQPYFLGYEGRCSFPSNFDCDYTYALGKLAIQLISEGATGLMAVIKNLKQKQEDWVPLGVPLEPMLGLEIRKGKEVLVIKKALVDLNSPIFLKFAKERERFAFEDDYISVGPIQFFGPEEITQKITETLKLYRSEP
jgi:pyrophosphate--fructose-6-phosphate 1-phosphotransferase